MEIIVKHHFFDGTPQERNAAVYYHNHARHYHSLGRQPYLLQGSTGLALCIALTATLKKRLRSPQADPDIMTADTEFLYYYPDDQHLKCPQCESRCLKIPHDENTPLIYMCGKCKSIINLNDLPNAQLIPLLECVDRSHLT